MCDSSIPVICFYNGNTERTETYVKYVWNKVVIVPLDVQIDCTYDRLLAMIYSMIGIAKARFKLVLTCKYPLKRENRFQPCPIWDDYSVYRMLKLVDTAGMEEIELYVQLVRVNPQVNQLVGTYINLLFGGNFNVEKLDYGCGPSSALVVVIDRCEVNENDQDYEDEVGDEDGDDERDGDGNVQAHEHVLSFLNINQLMENEQERYLSVDVPSCDVSNNLDPKDRDPKDPNERATANYYLAPSPQFKNVENFGNVVSNDWIPWVNYITTNSSGEFVVCNVFTSKVAISPRVPLVEVLMITNQGYWLLMVKDELSDRLKLIKHHMKII